MDTSLDVNSKRDNFTNSVFMSVCSIFFSDKTQPLQLVVSNKRETKLQFM